MALVLKKFGSFVTQLYRGDYCASSSSFRVRGLLIRGLPVYTDSKVQRKENDTRQEKNVDSKENQKITKEDQVFSASTVVRTRSRSPQPPGTSEGSGGKTH